MLFYLSLIPALFLTFADHALGQTSMNGVQGIVKGVVHKTQRQDTGDVLICGEEVRPMSHAQSSFFDKTFINKNGGNSCQQILEKINNQVTCVNRAIGYGMKYFLKDMMKLKRRKSIARELGPDEYEPYIYDIPEGCKVMNIMKIPGSRKNRKHTLRDFVLDEEYMGKLEKSPVSCAYFYLQEWAKFFSKNFENVILTVNYLTSPEFIPQKEPSYAQCKNADIAEAFINNMKATGFFSDATSDRFREKGPWGGTFYLPYSSLYVGEPCSINDLFDRDHPYMDAALDAAICGISPFGCVIHLSIVALKYFRTGYPQDRDTLMVKRMYNDILSYQQQDPPMLSLAEGAFVYRDRKNRKHLGTCEFEYKKDMINNKITLTHKIISNTEREIKQRSFCGQFPERMNYHCNRVDSLECASLMADNGNSNIKSTLKTNSDGELLVSYKIDGKTILIQITKGKPPI